MPALDPESIPVDHPLPDGEVVSWKGYELTAYYFPGQTVHHDGLLIEHDRTRIFMRGDSFADSGINEYCSYNRDFPGDEPGHEECFCLVLQLEPDMLVASHRSPPSRFRKSISRRPWTSFATVGSWLSALLPWDDPHVGLDPSWVRAYPYRQAVRAGQPVTLEA